MFHTLQLSILLAIAFWDLSKVHQKVRKFATQYWWVKFTYSFQNINIWCYGWSISFPEWCFWHLDSVFLTWGMAFCVWDAVTGILIAKMWWIVFVFHGYTLLKEVPFVFCVKKCMPNKYQLCSVNSGTLVVFCVKKCMPNKYQLFC